MIWNVLPTIIELVKLILDKIQHLQQNNTATQAIAAGTVVGHPVPPYLHHNLN